MWTGCFVVWKLKDYSSHCLLYESVIWEELSQEETKNIQMSYYEKNAKES